MTALNKNLELLLQLEELILLREVRQQGSQGEQREGNLHERINQLRRKVPGEVLSAFDRLARQYANTVVPVLNGVCQGCHQEIAPRLVRALEQRSKLARCEHCGRFLVSMEHLPDYVS